MVKKITVKAKRESSKAVKRREQIRGRISLVASILVGLTFLASGTGKLLKVEEAPAQVIDFISSFLPSVFITPATIYFLFDILVPIIIPWIELTLSICLLIGFWPRFMAVLCFPLISAFIGTNVWSIVKGGYTTCASCFGIWENYFGSLTSAQSLAYDLVLFALAIVIIIFHPGKLFSSREWLTKGRRFDFATMKSKVCAFGNQLRNLGTKVTPYLNLTSKQARRHPFIAISTVVCLTALIAGAIAVTSLSHTPKSDNVTVSELSETSAVISWFTDKPIASSIEVYSEDGAFTITIIHKKPTTTHKLLVAGLASGTNYHFKILSDGKQAISGEHSFSTPAKVTTPLTISEIKVTYITDTEANITWVTNRPATSKVEYWDPASVDRFTVSSDEFTTSHSLRLTLLKAGTIYHYRVNSTDANGYQATSPRLATSTLIGKQAPNFTLNTLDGESVTLNNYRGKLVMLDFWTWTCSACRAKMPIIQELYDRIPREKLAILAIHYRGREPVVRGYVKGEKLTFPVLIDSESKVSDLYNVYVFPTIFLIDRDGIIRLIDPEFDSAEQLENIISTLLKGT